MCWLAGSKLAVCRINGHTPTYLEGHAQPLVSLCTNHRNIVVTAAEDNAMRVWDLNTSICTYVITGVDVLDCAIHQDILVSYNNDNMIDVIDVAKKEKLNRIDIRQFGPIDQTILSREVKIAVWGDRIVCGFEVLDALRLQL